MSEVESKVFPVRQAPAPPPSPFIDQHNHDDIPTTTAAVTSPCFSATATCPLCLPATLPPLSFTPVPLSVHPARLTVCGGG
ncbi:hypothetical protein Pcinc_033340 [Petrolisthes cinctipes]|uniref:Uncharacterized protein n=1 Tax=Petrolisthes cinctipes TaxID=88211 RepID=A0AAE1JZI2_PETCI|nr:hypothetical protein Pcinc_033340 [Petrolisthes cinctipes]